MLNKIMYNYNNFIVKYIYFPFMCLSLLEQYYIKFVCISYVYSVCASVGRLKKGSRHK